MVNSFRTSRLSYGVIYTFNDALIDRPWEILVPVEVKMEILSHRSYWRKNTITALLE